MQTLSYFNRKGKGRSSLPEVAYTASPRRFRGDSEDEVDSVGIRDTMEVRDAEEPKFTACARAVARLISNIDAWVFMEHPKERCSQERKDLSVCGSVIVQCSPRSSSRAHVEFMSSKGSSQSGILCVLDTDTLDSQLLASHVFLTSEHALLRYNHHVPTTLCGASLLYEWCSGILRVTCPRTQVLLLMDDIPTSAV